MNILAPSCVEDVVRRVLLGVALFGAACTPVGEASPALAESVAAIAPAPPAPAPAPAPEQAEPQAEPFPEAPPPPACVGEPVPALPAHPGLALGLKSKTPSRIEPGQPIELVPSIRNTSKTSPHAAVLSGDGSERGWREPHVWYSGFVDAGDGCWHPLPPRVIPGCGMYDEDWSDEVVQLAPGASAALEWLPSPATTLDIPSEGHVRIFLHYAYRQGKTDRDGDEGHDLGAMEGTEAFELVSNPIEVELHQPLKLALTARTHRGLGNVSKLSDLVSLRLENTSSKARKVRPPATGILEFEVVGEEEYGVSVDWRSGDDALPLHRLGAGASVSLLGASSPNPALQVHWYPPKAEVVRIRASYQPYGNVQAPPLRSNWVEVDLR